MNDLPSDWSEQVQAVYPKRSGPSGWKGTRLMLALRRALLDSTWKQIMDGCRNYAEYCRDSGTEGSAFVLSPLRFIQDGCYLETLIYAAPEDPKVIELRRKEASRWECARGTSAELGLAADPRESLASLESRIAFARTRGPEKPSTDPEVRRRIADLAGRLRVAK